jgi:hypothetical protein
MWGVSRREADGGKFPKEEQGKLLFFMKISLSIDVSMEVVVGGWAKVITKADSLKPQNQRNECFFLSYVAGPMGDLVLGFTAFWTRGGGARSIRATDTSGNLLFVKRPEPIM